jgi:Fe-S-cluster-containing dehydrogenase component
VSKYALEINHESCWGCRTCEAACKQEFDTPSGIGLIRVLEVGPETIGGKLDFSYQVRVCRHCDEPACAYACPETAVTKRPDGIVVLDAELCTGCRLCLEACPYDTVDFDTEKGVAQKCNLCHNRVDHGLLPACADNICLSRCIRFIDTEGG